MTTFVPLTTRNRWYGYLSVDGDGVSNLMRKLSYNINGDTLLGGIEIAKLGSQNTKLIEQQKTIELCRSV